MPRVRSIATVVPTHCVDASESADHFIEHFPGSVGRRFARMVASSEIERRHVAIPLGKINGLRTHSRRNTEYFHAALGLCEEAARRAIELAGVDGREIDAIVAVSCTGYVMPSLDARLVNRLGLAPTVRRVPITELGCSAGAAALGVAAELLRGGGLRTILVTSVELCSLCMEQDDPTPGDLLGRILFADGAAAAILTSASGSSGPEIVASRSVLVPGSEDMLATSLTDGGFRLGLSSALPGLLRAHLRGAAETFLRDAGHALEDMNFFAVHPGGPRILEAVGAALDLSRSDMAPTWEVLERFGNTSSAAIFFVLRQLREHHRPRPGALGLVVAFGPGVSCELLLLRWAGDCATGHAAMGSQPRAATPPVDADSAAPNGRGRRAGV